MLIDNPKILEKIMKFLLDYDVVYNGCVIIEADSEEEAIDEFVNNFKALDNIDYSDTPVIDVWNISPDVIQ